MKIAIFVDQLTSHGGIEKLVAIKANYWVTKFKYDITIVSTENKNQPLIYELDTNVKLVDLNINYHRLKSFFSISNLRLVLLNIVKVQKYILLERPEKIIVASHIPMTYVLPFLYLGKTKIVKEFHFTKYYRAKNNTGLKHRLLNYIEGKYHARVVLSSEEQTFYNGENIQVIPNPVLSNTTIKQIPIAKKELLAVTVLRFAPVKRIELLVAIWEEFIKLQPNWQLKIYGPLDNDYAFQLQQQVKDKKLTNHIIFKGESDRVREEIAKARVFLMTSVQECLPMVLLEANSVGVPAIAFNCPTGPRNVINDKLDGFLVENNKIDKFVNILNTFCNNEELQETLAKNALKNSMNYSLEKVMNDWKAKILCIVR